LRKEEKEEDAVLALTKSDIKWKMRGALVVGSFSVVIRVHM